MVSLAEHALEQQLSFQSDSREGDPLDVYLRFLARRDIQSQAALFDLHKRRCVDLFAGNTRYRKDNRYITLCLATARGPADFLAMAQNRIGLESPAFYAAYARALARAGRAEDAKSVLRAGDNACGPLVYTDADLDVFLPDSGSIPSDPHYPPLPEGCAALGSRIPDASPFDEVLLVKGGDYCSLEEVVLDLRSISLSPFPRRTDPRASQSRRGPPAVYSQPDPRAMQSNEYIPDEDQRRNYKMQSISSRTPSGGSSHTSLGAHEDTSKSLQTVAFDEEPPIELVLPQAPPLDLPPVVDASLSSVRRQFVPRLVACLQAMGPLFVQNNYERHGYAELSKRANMPANLELTNINITVKKIIGSGGYGTVFSAVNPVHPARYALKLEVDNIPWECYTVSMTRSRLRNTRALKSIIRTYLYEGFLDEQFLLMPLIGYNSLLACANGIRSKQLSPGDIEIITAYFSVELLRVVEELHKAKIIHGDIKSENVMIRAPGDRSIHSGYLGRNYSPSGENRWDEYGILLIDFGRAIDLDLFPPGQRFEARWEVDHEQDCMEIRQGLPWTYEVDYHGIANVAYMLLFGQYIQISQEGSLRRMTTPISRYMDGKLWTRFFHVMLNYTHEQLPIINEMRDLRETMEKWLVKQADTKLHHLLANIAYDERRKRLI